MPQRKEIRLSKPIRTSALSSRIPFKEHKNYVKAKGIKTRKKELIVVTNPINHRSASVLLSREGITNKALSKILTNPKSTKDQKEAIIGAWMFEQGMENASFLSDIFRYKGQHAKETQAFKGQMRKDWEIFLEVFVRSMYAMSEARDMQDLRTYFKTLAEETTTVMRKLTHDRMKEKGFGIYIGMDGKAYEVGEAEFEQAIKEDLKAVTKKGYDRARDSS